MKYNRRMALLLMGAAAITTAIDGDATIFVFLLIVAGGLFFTKTRVIH
jgi:hypothetical protein